MEFKDQLILFRAKNGLSQEQAAAVLGVNKNTITAWEKGTTPRQTNKILALEAMEKYKK